MPAVDDPDDPDPDDTASTIATTTAATTAIAPSTSPTTSPLLDPPRGGGATARASGAGSGWKRRQIASGTSVCVPQ